jgi:hypothetical protein
MSFLAEIQETLSSDFYVFLTSLNCIPKQKCFPNPKSLFGSASWVAPPSPALLSMPACHLSGFLG